MIDRATLARQRELLARRLGPGIVSALEDTRVTNVLANPDGKVWVKRNREEYHLLEGIFSDTEREATIGLVAKLLGGEVNEQSPIVEGELPFSKHRFEGILPPVSEAPLFVIRTHHLAETIRLEEYIHAGILDHWQAGTLRAAVLRGNTLIISGAQDSGKTTLASALLADLVSCPDYGFLRPVILEDTRELRCPADKCIRLRSGNGKTLGDLVRATQRLSATRIIVGEVRGGEALDLLKAWNTGLKGGLTTLHANSVADVFDRLAMLVAETGMALPRALFARAVSLLVHIVEDGGQRRVTEIARVVPQGHDYELNYLTEKRTL